MVQFQLLEANASIPSGYRLATTQDVQNNKQDVFKAMPGWEIANLANGSVDGASYGGNVRGDIRNDVSQKLVVYDPNSVSQPSNFRLLNANDSLPQGYRLATVQDVQANPQAQRAAMPGWEIANLANGSVDGASYGCNIRHETRNDVSQKLAVYDPNSVSQPSNFRLLNANDSLPQGYRLATVQDVQANPQAQRAAMPGWEIANLANGSVDGASYGCNIRNETRSDVSQKLAVYDPNSVSQQFQLFNANDSLPQGYRLATVQDVQANPQALRAAMPGWEIANLANGSVDGASYGCNIRYETRSDVSQKLATRGNASGPLKFQLFNVGDQLPPSYRLATRYDVESNKQALFQAMPGWEIANLADGSVDGASYGGRVSTNQRNDVSQKLAVQGR